MFERFILHTQSTPHIQYVAELHGETYHIWFIGDENKPNRMEGHWSAKEVYKQLKSGNWIFDGVDNEEYAINDDEGIDDLI